MFILSIKILTLENYNIYENVTLSNLLPGNISS